MRGIDGENTQIAAGQAQLGVYAADELAGGVFGEQEFASRNVSTVNAALIMGTSRGMSASVARRMRSGGVAGGLRGTCWSIGFYLKTKPPLTLGVRSTAAC
jgi:hypothetical protein